MFRTFNKSGMSVKSPPQAAAVGSKIWCLVVQEDMAGAFKMKTWKPHTDRLFQKPCKKIPLLTCVPWNEKRGVKWKKLKKRKRVVESKSTWAVTCAATFVCKHGNYAHWSGCKKVLLKEPLPFHADPILPPNKNDSWLMWTNSSSEV